MAAAVGITERATQRIVADLVEAGYLERERVAVSYTHLTLPTSDVV